MPKGTFPDHLVRFDNHRDPTRYLEPPRSLGLTPLLSKLNKPPSLAIRYDPSIQDFVDLSDDGTKYNDINTVKVTNICKKSPRIPWGRRSNGTAYEGPHSFSYREDVH